MSLLSMAASTALSPLSLLTSGMAKAKAQASASAKAAADAATSTTTGGGLTSSTAGSTFLNLLVKELQNQDPSAPMDSTAMVGQMISLNQLDQLISINQVLAGATTKTTAHAKSATNAVSSASMMAQQTALLTGNTTQAQAQARAAASDPNSVLNFSSLNIPFGGK